MTRAYLQKIEPICFNKISDRLIQVVQPRNEAASAETWHKGERRPSLSSTQYRWSQGLYLYDLDTDEQMLVYKPDTVTMDCEFTKASTIAARLEVWIL